MCASSNSNQSGQVVILRYILSLLSMYLLTRTNTAHIQSRAVASYMLACVIAIGKRSTYNVIALKCTYISKLRAIFDTEACVCAHGDGESLMEILQRLQTASVVSHIFLILLGFYCSHKFRFSVCESRKKTTHIKHAINKMACMRAYKCSWVCISHPLQRYCLMVICAPEFHRNCI